MIRFYHDGELPSRLIYPHRSLLLVGGVTGAGKSTLLERCAPPSALLLNADDCRVEVQRERGLDPHLYDDGSVDEARRRFFGSLDAALADSRDVIVDATLLQDKARQELASHARPHGYGLHMIVIEASLQECLRGVSQRARSVPADKVRHYHALWHDWRIELSALASAPHPLSSLVVIDRSAASALQEIRFADTRMTAPMTA